MKKNTPLHITIPKPCSQNWDAMPAAGDGRHCMQCNNIIYDFSQMNDEELFNFFTQRPDTRCGRFHNTQLQRDILPLVQKRSVVPYKFIKMAAAIFAVLSFKSLAVTAAKKQNLDKEVLPMYGKSKAAIISDSVFISGVVKDGGGQPLIGAMVELGNLKDKVFTDHEGKFTIAIDLKNTGQENLYFSYGDLVTAVRTYHPAMLSTVYDVVLSKRGDGFHTMGIALPTSEQLGALPSLLFKTNTYKLSADNKAMLAAIAAKMKSVPDALITVNAYAGSCGRQYIYGYRVNNIKKYLVEKEGISSDRITTNVEVGGGDQNTVDIKSGN